MKTTKEDILNEMGKAGRLTSKAMEIGAENLAIILYAPLFLMIQLYDGGMNLNVIKNELAIITREYEKEWLKC